jgi:hypothetical protein
LWAKWRWGRFYLRTFVSFANFHSTNHSTTHLSSMAGTTDPTVADVLSGLSTNPPYELKNEVMHHPITTSPELLGFWTLSSVRYLKKKLKNRIFRKLDLLPKRCVLSCFLEYRAMGKLEKSSNPECYTPPLEPFRIYLFTRLLTPYYTIRYRNLP